MRLMSRCRDVMIQIMLGGSSGDLFPHTGYKIRPCRGSFRSLIVVELSKSSIHLNCKRYLLFFHRSAVSNVMPDRDCRGMNVI